MNINSYPKIYNLGHRAVRELFDNPVFIEEKIDGSQFSMARIGGELKVRSKGKEIFIDNPEKMFERAVEIAKGLTLKEGWIYRCEYLQNPKHNTIKYDRIPAKHLIVFDIDTSNQAYLNYEQKRLESARLGLECVPHLGIVQKDGNSDLEEFDLKHFKEVLETESILGGSKIEGVVIKNYAKFGPDGKVLMGKFVSEAFKEKHRDSWKPDGSKKEVLQTIITGYKTEARWNKAVQHLREKGLIEDSPKDIGKIIKEVQEDFLNECEDEVKEMLYKWAKQNVLRGIVSRLAEWYKEKLLEKQFEE